MNLYRVSQNVNNDYDTFSDAIVLAESADEASKTHPGSKEWDEERGQWFTTCEVGPYKGQRFYDDSKFNDTWAQPKDVKVELVGVADRRYVTMNVGRVVCASFHAG